MLKRALVVSLLFSLPAMAEDKKTEEVRHPYMLTDAEAQAVAQALARPSCQVEGLIGSLNSQYLESRPKPAAEGKK